MSKEQKIERFNPNEKANINNNIFGLPFNSNESQIILIPVPWDVTTSYFDGASKAPEAIFNASFQVDLYDAFVKDAWKKGISMDWISEYWINKNNYLRKKSINYAKYSDKKITLKNIKRIRHLRNEINIECKNLNNWVKEQSIYYLNKNKLVGIIGGDHSSPLGLIEALSEKYAIFSILHIDAHADLRRAYEGFQYSHASIMYNALKIEQISKLVQVGIRDYCENEMETINNSNNRIITFFDRDIKHQLFNGKSWTDICYQIISHLTEHIYISFDIDGLDPKLCPNTGTPVGGGFELEEIIYLFENIVESGKKIIGFDLCEVVPDPTEWNANIGARILYRLSNITAKSNDYLVI